MGQQSYRKKLRKHELGDHDKNFINTFSGILDDSANRGEILHIELEELVRNSGFMESEEMVEGINVEINDKFQQACRDGDIDIVRIALCPRKHLSTAFGDKGIQTSANNNHAIKIASKHGHVDIVRMLLALTGDRAVDPSAEHNYAIQQACKHGHEDVVRELLCNGKVDATDGGNCAIRSACINGHTEIVRMLLALDGDREVDAAIDNNDAIIVASRKGYIEIVRMLLASYRHNIDATAMNDSAICHAVENGHIEIVRMLLTPIDGRPRVNHTVSDGFTLRIAADKGYTEIVRMLLAASDHSHRFRGYEYTDKDFISAHQLALDADRVEITHILSRKDDMYDVEAIF